MDEHRDPIQRFLTWEASSAHVGTLGLKNEDEGKYIPKTLLDTYFKSNQTIKAILDVFFKDHRVQPDAYWIREHYLLGFAILLSMGKGPMIAQFVDHSKLQDKYLPFSERPSTGFPTLSDGDFFTSFYQRQWKYLPQELNYRMRGSISPDVILPFQVCKEKLGRGRSANVHKIVVDDDCNKLGHPADQSSPKCFFALKTFRGNDAAKHFETEKAAFEQLNRDLRTPPNIVLFHGSFIRDQSYNLILEYADLGTLRDFMQGNTPPSKGEDIIILWRRLFELMLGLQNLHEAGGGVSGLQFMSGWHQDVKPTNILVKSRKGADSIYDVDFMLADFGLSHFKLSNSSPKDLTDHDTFGTYAYGAPETYRINHATTSIQYSVDQSVDIWSLGCIFSEVATWIVHGWPGVEQYQIQRQNEAATKLKDPDVGDLFHDAEKVLDAVEQCHGSIQESRRVDDFMTPRVIQDVIGGMLESHRVRLHTRQACNKAEKALRAATEELVSFRSNSTPKGVFPSHRDSSQPAQPSSKHSQPPQQDGAVENAGGTEDPSNSKIDQVLNDESPPRISVESVLKWRNTKKYVLNARLPDVELLQSIRDRDSVFVVDNTSSMLGHKPALRKVLEAIVYTVKTYDHNGVDLLFTQSDRKVLSTKKTKAVLEEFDKVNFTGRTDMQHYLGDILEGYKRRITGQHILWRSWIHGAPSRKPPRKLSLHVLTNGHWHPGCDVASVIRSMVSCLTRHELRNAQVAIQFIRFGTGTPEIQQLKYLDEGLKLELDIVDTTPSDGSVWKMILGAILPWFDNDNGP